MTVPGHWTTRADNYWENLRENHSREEETKLKQMHLFGVAASHLQSGQTLTLEEKPWQCKASLQDALCSIVGIGKLQDRIKKQMGRGRTGNTII